MWCSFWRNIKYSERLIQVRHITATITDLGGGWENGFIWDDLPNRKQGLI
jgi:hypothetical protein